MKVCIRIKHQKQKRRWQPVRTSVRVFVSFVYIQVSTRTTPKNEYSSFYMYRTPKTKKAVYTRIKHPNRKWRFLHVGSIQNENSCFCTEISPKTKMGVSTRIKHPKPKWCCLFPLYIFRFPHVEHPKTNIQVCLCTELLKRKRRFIHVYSTQIENEGFYT